MGDSLVKRNLEIKANGCSLTDDSGILTQSHSKGP